MKGLSAFKERHPRWFRFADRCLAYFVLFPCVVAFWAGVWLWLDGHVYPDDKAVSGWTCAAVGIVILIFFNVVQYELTERFLEPAGKVRNILVKRVYTCVAAVANVLFCRGLWIVQDHYSGITVESACFSFGLGTFLLVALRASCNGISSPLGTAFDEHRSFFIIQTRFNATGERPFLLFLDSVFSVTVIGTLVIFEWRGIWSLFDLLLFPDQPHLSIICCLAAGYFVCIAMDSVQQYGITFSAYLERRHHWFVRLAFEDVYLFLAKLSIIAVWHGIWQFCEVIAVVRLGVWLPIGLGYVIPTLLLHANTLFVLEVVLDGGLVEGLGCRLRVTVLENYIKLCAKNKDVKKKKKEALLSGMAVLEMAPVLMHKDDDDDFVERSLYLDEILPPSRRVSLVLHEK